MKNTQYVVADVRIERLLLLMRQVCYLYTTSAMFLILSHDTMRTKMEFNKLRMGSGEWSRTTYLFVQRLPGHTAL